MCKSGEQLLTMKENEKNSSGNEPLTCEPNGDESDSCGIKSTVVRPVLVAQGRGEAGQAQLTQTLQKIEE